MQKNDAGRTTNDEARMTNELGSSSFDARASIAPGVEQRGESPSTDRKVRSRRGRRKRPLARPSSFYTCGERVAKDLSSFGLRHSFVIRASSFVIPSSFPLPAQPGLRRQER